MGKRSGFPGSYEFNPFTEDESRELRGGISRYGRHKNEEFKRTEEFVEKLRNNKIKPVETYSTILKSGTERPKSFRLNRNLSDHSSKSPSWKKVRKQSVYSKPSDSPKYQKSKKAFLGNIHKEEVQKPKIIGMRILSDEEAEKIRAKLRQNKK